MDLGRAMRIPPRTKKCRVGDAKQCKVVVWKGDPLVVVKHVDGKALCISWLKQQRVTLPADELVEIPGSLHASYTLILENVETNTTVRRVGSGE